MYYMYIVFGQSGFWLSDQVLKLMLLLKKITIKQKIIFRHAGRIILLLELCVCLLAAFLSFVSKKRERNMLKPCLLSKPDEYNFSVTLMYMMSIM